MNRFFVFLSFFLLVFSGVFSQDSLVLQGRYYGKNLYILNPSAGSDTTYCVQKVMVNGHLSKDEFHSNSFEVDFSLLNIPNGDPVRISIIHGPSCHPKVVNPEVIELQSTFAFINVKADKAGKLFWTVKGDLYNSFIVEQFRWKKWINIGEVSITDTVKNNSYDFETKPHFGANQFRISYTDEKGNLVYSKIIKFKSTTLKEIFIVSAKVTNEITFTGETAYEIFDEKGNFIMDGYGTLVNITDIPKGKYWVNYDNKTEMVTKK